MGKIIKCKDSYSYREYKIIALCSGEWDDDFLSRKSNYSHRKCAKQYNRVYASKVGDYRSWKNYRNFQYKD